MAARAMTTPDVTANPPTTCLSRLGNGEPFAAVMERPSLMADSSAGNVKVVVRVRKFIKRGEGVSLVSDRQLAVNEEQL